MTTRGAVWVVGMSMAAMLLAAPARARQVVRADLMYRAPVTGAPSPNFSPKGTQVALTDVAADMTLPDGALRPAKTGTIRIGPSDRSWVTVLLTADAENPKELCRLYVDLNRNRSFLDDGPSVVAKPTPREKTGDVWTSFSRIEMAVPYGRGPGGDVSEPYMVSMWAVRPADGPPPDIVRYSVNSWRSGTVSLGGVEAFVAVMDADNDAVFGKDDTWSVLEASAPDAAKQVLSIAEARATGRLMFVKAGAKEQVLDFRALSQDGRTIEFAVVDRPVTKAADRAGDDGLRDERARPRATAPFPWGTAIDTALTQAKASDKRVIIDFWTSWCGPCKTMDEWVWSDAAVAGVLGGGYVGVKLDGDLEKVLATKFNVIGYPTMIVLDPAGNEIARAVGYQSSKQMLELLTAKR
jgi:thiol-disulfide isomerase/thioredoxin